MKPVVSIITPVFNHELFIKDCIESVLSQSYPYWEQIIIDDGSTDMTSSIVSTFRDERIKYIYQENIGIHNLYKTYNKALNVSRGKYIAILEGDDYWPSDKLEKQLAYFDSSDVILTWGKAMWVTEDRTPLRVAPIDIESYFKIDMMTFLRRLLYTNFIPAVTVIIRKDILDMIGGFRQVSYLPLVDYPTWLHLSTKGKFIAVDSILGYWRRHDIQMSTRRQHEILEGAMQYSQIFFDELPEEYKDKLKITSQEIKKIWKRNISESALYEGIQFNNCKKWHHAKKEFLFSIKHAPFSLKIKGILGLMATILHIRLIKLVDVLFKLI